MKKVSDAVEEIVSTNPSLNFGFHHRLLNLSQAARFIRPLVEARTHKEVKASAVLMSLCRLQSKQVSEESFQDIALDELNVRSGLCSLTVFKTRESMEELNRLFAKVRSRNGFITITEGISEITAILEDSDFESAKKMLSDKPRHIYRNIASVGVKLTDEILDKPGVIYRILQQVALQNISVIEIASTATELNIYVHEQDLRLAFDSVYRRFSRRARGRSDF